MNNDSTGAERPYLETMRSRDITSLECVVENVNSGYCSLGYALDCADVSLREVLEDRRKYWFLFDNLNRASAQLLWFADWNFRRDGIVMILPHGNSSWG